MKNGLFIISLDFELMWGVRDVRTINNYGKEIVNTHQVIDYLINIFNNYEINATFSVVGFLFAKNKRELINYFPNVKPEYLDGNLSPYNGYIDSIGENFEEDKFHYGLESIRKLKKYTNHEISTHTFSHYYCLEDGQSKLAFKEDIKSAVAIAQKEGIIIKSIVFPRNQYNSNYKDCLIENGISIIRGNEEVWFYNPKKRIADTFFRRLMRLLDTYINISGHNCFTIKQGLDIINIPSSRFLRPYNSRLGFLEKFRLKRIKKSMTYAAKNNLAYHLWWHPHNFGSNFIKNQRFLELILDHYTDLNKKYNFESQTMKGSCKQTDKPQII